MTSPYGPEEVYLADQAFPSRKPPEPVTRVQIYASQSHIKAQMPDGTIYEFDRGTRIADEINMLVAAWKKEQ